MNRKLLQWILESVEVDMKKEYRHQLELTLDIDFIGRYSDFFTNLLTRAYHVLNDEIETVDTWEKKRSELMAIAKGMQVFGSKMESGAFDGVNRNETTLYVAVLYYICGYEAVASLLLKDCQCTELSTEEAKTIFYILSGGKSGGETLISQSVQCYLLTGNDELISNYEYQLIERCSNVKFDNVDVFFDSELLRHVLRKFMQNNLRYDLYQYDKDTDWTDYIKYSYLRNIFCLLPSQRDAIDKGLLKFARSFSLQMPTSAGKSYLTELLIYQELKRNENAKILYLAPLRSLSYELKIKYAKISRKLGFSYRCIYGGSSISVTESFLHDADMLITTPETLMSLEGSVDSLLSSFSFIICDEGQLLESAGRGLNYELLLSRLKLHESARFLFISAIIPNIGDINVWLGGDVAEVGNSKHRPCIIRFAESTVSDNAIDLKIYENLNNQALFSIQQFVRPNECNGLKLQTNRDVACLIALKSLDAGSVMLYTSFKRGSAGCETYGNKILQIINRGVLPSPASFVNEKQQIDLELRKEYFQYLFGNDYCLSQYISHGYCIHHGSLPQEVREIIELGYSKGSLRLLVCNSTLAEGVNFPIRTLILGDIRSPQGNGVLMDKEILMNVIGRAGRAGEETYGLVVAPSDKFWYVKQAADADGLNSAKGMLNEIADEISSREDRVGRRLINEEINQVIEQVKLGDSIDLMILRSTDNFSIATVSPESISTSTLTYHLAADNKKDCLKRLFIARYDYLRNVEASALALYRETGLNPQQIIALDHFIASDCGISSLTEYNMSEDVWLSAIFNAVDQCEDIEDIDEHINILKLWMNGLMYKDISTCTGKTIDEVLMNLDFITNSFLMQSKSIIKYLTIRFGVTNDSIGLWSYFVERGLNSSLQVELLKKGLSDRIALHVLSNYAKDNELESLGVDDLIHLMQIQEMKVADYVKSKGIPRLTQMRIENFLRNK